MRFRPSFAASALASVLTCVLACSETDQDPDDSWLPDASAAGGFDAASTNTDATPEAGARTADASLDAGAGAHDAQSATDAAGSRDAGRATEDAGRDAAPSVEDTGVRDAGPTRDAGPASEAGTTAPGDGGTVNDTIVVHAGETYDGQGKRYRAGSALGDGSQSESQKPVFKLEDGATLRNVVLGAPAADGIHTYGDVLLENIVWEDIGEDAMTIKAPGTVILDGGSARNGDDKVFQINAASTFRVSNFNASQAGKFIRQNGGTTFRVDVFIEHCDISKMSEAIFRTDSSISTVSMKNTRYSQIGAELFYGVNPANITQSGNTKY